MRQPPFGLLVIALAGAGWKPELLIGLAGLGAAFLLFAILYNLASPVRGRV
jgi:hypothetical protein